jgi:hypothetical protein
VPSGSGRGQGDRTNIRGALKRASDADLEALGLQRDQIDDLEQLRFESPRDGTRGGEEILKLLEQCPKMETRQVS